MKSTMFSLSKEDFLKGAVFAVISGIILPLSVAMQEPSFSIFTANWQALLDVAVKGAVSGFLSFMGQAFFSDENGKVFGRIG